MAAVSQTTLSNTFSWMKKLEFRLKFHWSLFRMGPINNIWTSDILGYRRIYASLSLSELTPRVLVLFHRPFAHVENPLVTGIVKQSADMLRFDILYAVTQTSEI